MLKIQVLPAIGIADSDYRARRVRGEVSKRLRKPVGCDVDVLLGDLGDFIGRKIWLMEKIVELGQAKPERQASASLRLGHGNVLTQFGKLGCLVCQIPAGKGKVLKQFDG